MLVVNCSSIIDCKILSFIAYDCTSICNSITTNQETSYMVEGKLVTNKHIKNHQTRKRINPKNTPTATTWWVVFCGLEVYGWDMSTTHATLTPERDWELNVKNSWRNPAKRNLFWNNNHLRDKCGTLVKQTQRNLGETLMEPWWNLDRTLVEPWSNLPQNLLAAQHGSAPENQGEPESNSAPKPLLWLKLLLLGNKNLSNQHSTYDKGAGNINYLKYGTIWVEETRV